MPELGVVSGFLNPIISAAAGLVGVYVGGLWSDRRERQKRHVEFITRQLAEFYGPLVSTRAEIRARGEIRVKVGDAAQEEWPKLIQRVKSGGIDAIQRVSDERGEEFRKIIDYDNKALRDVLMPAYRQMISTFREKMWLAEPETRAFFGDLIEFVEIWERHLDKALPIEVIQRIGHTESNLAPFYEHLEKVHDRLRASASKQ